MLLPDAVARGEFGALAVSAVSRAAETYAPFHRRRGQIVCDRIFYIEQGAFVLGEGTPAETRFTAGDAVYLPPDVTYVSRWLPGATGRFTTVNFRLFGTDGRAFSLADGICLFVHDARGELLAEMRGIVRCFTRAGAGYRPEASSRLIAILAHALRGGYGDAPPPAGTDKAIQYLEEHFLEDVSQHELAAMAGVGECMLRRAFRQKTGLPPHHLRTLLRLEYARSLLTGGECTVLDAALAAGYDDASYFSRAFRRQFGVPPSAVRPGAKKSQKI